MSSVTSEADRRGPRVGEIAVIATTGASQNTDLSAVGQFGNVTYQDHFVEIVCDQDLFYFWSGSNADTVDDTATAGATRGMYLAAKAIKRERPNGQYFVCKAAAGKVRIAIAETTIDGKARVP